MNPVHTLDRWLYRGGRPNRLARVLNGLGARVAAAGFGTSRMVTLEVVGRRSGRPVSFPLVPTEYEGEQYLVSMLGDHTNWVRNVRAAHGEAVLRHGRRDNVRLVEVPVAERAPILRRFLDRAPGARPHIPVRRGAPEAEFAAVAARYPVFRVVVLP